MLAQLTYHMDHTDSPCIWLTDEACPARDERGTRRTPRPAAHRTTSGAVRRGVCIGKCSRNALPANPPSPALPNRAGGGPTRFRANARCVMKMHVLPRQEHTSPRYTYINPRILEKNTAESPTNSNTERNRLKRTKENTPRAC